MDLYEPPGVAPPQTETTPPRPPIDYQHFQPERDYFRRKIDHHFPAYPPTRDGYYSCEQAQNALDRITGTRAIRDVLSYGSRPDGFSWRTDRSVGFIPAPDGQPPVWWYEVEYRPEPPDKTAYLYGRRRSSGPDTRRGYLLRLDPNTGNPLEQDPLTGQPVVDQKGRPVSARWTEAKMLELRNALAELSGQPRINIPPHPADTAADRVAANFTQYNSRELPEYVVGQAVPPAERRDASSPAVQAIAAAAVLGELANIGTRYSHRMESRYCGLIASGNQHFNGDFRLDAREEAFSQTVSRIRSGLEAGQVMTGGIFSLEDTQRNIIQVYTREGTFAVRTLRRQLVQDPDTGRMEESDQLRVTADAQSIAGHRSEQASYNHGDDTDHRNRLTRMVADLNIALYRASVPVDGRTIAACLEFNAPREYGAGPMEWAKKDSARILVRAHGTATEEMTWQQLWEFIQEHKAPLPVTEGAITGDWISLADIKKSRDGDEADFEPLDDYWDSGQDAVYVASPPRKSNPAIHDIPDGIILCKVLE